MNFIQDYSRQFLSIFKMIMRIDQFKCFLIFICLIFQLLLFNKLYANEFFPLIETEGKTQVTIYPIESVHPNITSVISFGIPFPKGFLSDLATLRLLDESGKELAIFTKTLSPWRNLTTLSNENSIRSALVQTHLSFSDTNNDGRADPRVLTVEWGYTERTEEGIIETPVRENWVRVDDQLYPEAEQVFEPNTFAVFPTQWYEKSIIKSRIYAQGTHQDFSNYESFSKQYLQTSINKVDPRVSAEYITDYTSTYSAWLFDRPMALYQVAMKTGDFKIFREAHRASQFYAQKVSDSGYFTLKPVNDLKYSYAEGIAANFWLTGDPNHLIVIDTMLSAFKSFSIPYTLDTNFWTERHAATALMGFVVAYEVLGLVEVGQLAKNTFSSLFEMQNNPAAGVPKTGALMHTRSSHGEGEEEFMSSPWMTALLVDAVERYYIHSSDTRVPQFIFSFADYFINEGLYYTSDFFGDSLPKSAVPYYISGPELSDAQKYVEPWSNAEHSLDVSKIFALAYFFTRVEGEPNQQYLNTFSDLYKTANEFVLPYWIRPDAPSAKVGTFSAGLPTNRLAPPRKFNWWFRTTSNIDWLIGQETSFESTQDINLAEEKNAIVSVVITTDKLLSESSDIITYTLTYENVGKENASGTSIWGSFKTNKDYFEIIPESISHGGTSYGYHLFWPIGEIEHGSESRSVSFSAKIVKPELVFSSDRPSPAILFQAIAKYGNVSDTQDQLIPSTNIWERGIYSHSRAGSSILIPTEHIFVNKPPMAIDQSLHVNEDVVLNLTLRSEVQENQTALYEILSAPVNGAINGTGSEVTYIPEGDFNGKDSFEFKVTDLTGATDVGIIQINVAPINDAPSSFDLALTIEQDMTKQISLAGEDVDGIISVFNYTLPNHGSLTGVAPNLRYTANPTYQGIDEFTYVAIDELGIESNKSIVTITIIPFDNPPVAESQTIIMNEDSNQDIILFANDEDNSELSFKITSYPSKGAISGTLPFINYKPDENFSGEDSFSFVANDGYKDSNIAEIKLLITDQNDAPIAPNISLDTYMNVPVSADLTAIDLENDNLTYQLILEPNFGEISGHFPNVTYHPNSHYIGVDKFTYQVFDGTAYTESTVFVEVKDGSEFRTFIEKSMDAGKLASWIGNYILTRLSFYQEQLNVIESITSNSNYSMEEKILAQHKANMLIVSVFSYLNYAPKDNVYDHIKQNVISLIFKTLTSEKTEFEIIYNNLYLKFFDEGINDWAINESIKFISQIDYYYGLQFSGPSNIENHEEMAYYYLEKGITFIATYVENNPDNISYKTIYEELINKRGRLFNPVEPDFNTYIVNKVDENDLPSWIGNYVLTKLNAFEQQVVLIQQYESDSNTSAVDLLKTIHVANMYIFSAHSYLNYANRDHVYEYINKAIEDRLDNTLSSESIELQSLYEFLYQEIKISSGHGWPIGETIKNISIFDYYNDQTLQDSVNADLHRAATNATLEDAIVLIESYIEIYPNIVVYQSIKNLLNNEIRAMVN